MGDMRRDALSSHLGDEVGSVIGLVGAEGSTPVRVALAHHRRRSRALGRAARLRRTDRNDEVVAVLHQQVPHVAELGACAVRMEP
ncbi:MAG: hypothetical protein B7Z58_16985 [Acidiphilium sp. 37-64-53]|nr:MAG: hypothetical protein B7Z58_16985 [Acidiphilium sp. 37-64-53]OZB22463.1 MAG: hypothetical protein B7X49_17060 [Acidiphilium sp. 34-64-41]